MNNMTYITIFAAGDDNRDGFVCRATVYFRNLLKSESGGITDAGILKIRIPSDEPLRIKTGDRVLLGCCEELDYKNSFFIYSISENLKGRARHIRLLCR
ncbi:MAG: hypothetical protein J1F64_11355 [Oscillospiraceae bacterium]|nr:hypothetical protein [Oscillospiraceae bacterium]